MTEITKEIFQKYEVRKTKKQKTAFIEFVTQKATELGYKVTIEKGSFGVRNIVIGDVDSAKAIYTAHYDTCAVLPFPNFITPKCFLLYLLYQLLITFGIFAAAFFVGTLAGVAASYFDIGSWVSFPAVYLVIFGLFGLMLFGPANKHTANDNTSGVTVLLDIMASLDENDKQNAAFVFFDLEEAGLLGSSAFASKHKKIKKEKLLINFDCVSDGDDILLILPKKARHLANKLNSAFLGDGKIKCEVVTKGVFYPSDQASFKLGVGVAAFRKTKNGLLYLNRIHTKKDTVYEQKNIDFLKNGLIKLLELL